jgi:hypothetical protein
MYLKIKKFLLFGIFLSKSITGQVISTVTGNGSPGYAGDGGPCLSAQINSPVGIGTDTAGNIYIADNFNHCIRKISAGSGIITTIAGTGTSGFSGDGGPAALAQLYLPSDVICDSTGNIYIADQNNNRIRKITISTGIITTIAGNGFGYSGDGGPAIAALFKNPLGIAFDKSGNIIVADANNHCLRKIDMTTNIITTIAGNGTAGFSGDGGPAISALVSHPAKMAFDTAGNMFFTDEVNNRIRKIAVGTGIISTIAGTGTFGYGGDGGPATGADFKFPIALDLDIYGNIYVADIYNNRIRKIDTATNMINTVAGNGIGGYTGDGGPATSAEIHYPEDILISKTGDLYFPEYGSHVIRKVSDIATVLEKERKTKKITVYPDPVINRLCVPVDLNSKIVNVSIWNVQGKMIYSSETNRSDLVKYIDVTPYSNGMYFLLLSGEGKVYSAKFVISR